MFGLKRIQSISKLLSTRNSNQCKKFFSTSTNTSSHKSTATKTLENNELKLKSSFPPKQMKALVLEKINGELKLQTSFPTPIELQSNEVLIKVGACGICHRDLLDRKGAFPFIQTPIILGHEIAGEIVGIGNSVNHFHLGERVATLHWSPCLKCDACSKGNTTVCSERQKTFLALTQNGGYAQYMKMGASGLVHVPNSFSIVDAATVACSYGTFWHSAVKRGRLRPAESVLITGVSGGVGSAGAQIARALGCDVFGVTSNPNKIDFLKKDIGLSEENILISKDNSFHQDPKLKKLQGGGVDLVFETVGAPTFASSLRALKPGGRLVLIGNVSAGEVKLKLGFSIINEIEIIGGDSITQTELYELFAFLHNTNIRPHIHKIIGLEEIESAHQILETKSVTGRIVVKF